MGLAFYNSNDKKTTKNIYNSFKNLLTNYMQAGEKTG